MKPMTRRSRGGVLLNHENRVQTLERRIPEDYPHAYGVILDQVNNITGPVSDNWTYTFPDECSGPAVECEDGFVTDGSYVLLPTGYSGLVHIYMNASLVGGAGNMDNAYQPTTLGDSTPSKMVRIGASVEVWRDNAPFGFLSLWAFQAYGENLNGQGGFLADRLWWSYQVLPGMGISDRSRDRYAILPYYSVGAIGPISLTGILNIEIDPPEYAVPGAGF